MNFIKHKLQKWLNIEPVPTTKDIRTIASQQIEDLFSQKMSYKRDFWVDFERAQNRVKDAINEACREHAQHMANITINQHIKGEQFLDEIVERIKRKQLTSK